MTGFHVIVVDDHPLMLDALTQIISSAPDLLIVKACLTCAEALAAVRSYRSEILLLDAQLPDVSGVDMIPTFVAVSPETRIVVFTATLDRPSMINALRAGAKAVLLKTSPPEQLLAAIRAVAVGEKWDVPDEIERSMHRQRPAPFDIDALSPRERQIAERVARGARNKEIAWELGLSEGTVKLHIYHAFRKLGVGNRVGLSRMFSQTGTATAEDASYQQLRKDY